MDKDNMSLETLVVHGAQKPDPTTGAISTPIYQTSTFVFKDPDHGARLFRGEEEGYIYTRVGNPTIEILERKLALLESAEAGVAFASGMAAIFNTIISIASAGDHIIVDDTVYGGTYALMTKIIPRLGIEVSIVNCADEKEIESKIKGNTRLIFFETPSNPTLKVIDIGQISRLGHDHKLVVVVDNTFATPILQRPIEHGADIVVHSMTKYLSGHGDTIGGIVVGRREYIERLREETAIDVGSCISPFNAWLILRGIKTLYLRMIRHSENAYKVARFLKDHPKVERVMYPGLEDDPGHKIARKQMLLFGGMVSFEIAGGREAGKRLLSNLNLCTLAVSLGDTDTLIEHPASMTHSTYSDEECLKFGITPGLIRISVGIENGTEICEDLARGLEGV
ncbi:methionine gamma-lyase [candidate division WOR-3 bacterium]|uniref:Methionine gamma-lyase n=1 Tax=candidate division WOR-3 bacterium TaxID=2052148 RepID=A0A660SNP6_UNCW3|nr:MAG: methionine gamma-lyase [candidate division WOR-3 bacterium]